MTKSQRAIERGSEGQARAGRIVIRSLEERKAPTGLATCPALASSLLSPPLLELACTKKSLKAPRSEAKQGFCKSPTESELASVRQSYDGYDQDHTAKVDESTESGTEASSAISGASSAMHHAVHTLGRLGLTNIILQYAYHGRQDNSPP